MASKKTSRRFSKISVDDLTEDQFLRYLESPPGTDDLTPTQRTKDVISPRYSQDDSSEMSQAAFGGAKPATLEVEANVTLSIDFMGDAAPAVLVLLLILVITAIVRLIVWRRKMKLRSDHMRGAISRLEAIPEAASAEQLCRVLVETAVLGAVQPGMDSDELCAAIRVSWEQKARLLHSVFSTESSADRTFPAVEAHVHACSPIPSAVIACHVLAAFQEALSALALTAAAHSSPLLPFWQAQLNKAHSALRADIDRVSARLRDLAASDDVSAASESAALRGAARLRLTYEDVELSADHRLTSRFLRQLSPPAPSDVLLVEKLGRPGSRQWRHVAHADLNRVVWCSFYGALSSALHAGESDEDALHPSSQQQALRIIQQRQEARALRSALSSAVRDLHAAATVLQGACRNGAPHVSESGDDAETLRQQAIACAKSVQAALRAIRGGDSTTILGRAGALVPDALIREAAEALAELDGLLREHDVARIAGSSIRGSSQQLAVCGGPAAPLLLEDRTPAIQAAQLERMDDADVRRHAMVSQVHHLAVTADASSLAVNAARIQRAAEQYGAAGAAAQQAMLIHAGLSGPLQHIVSFARSQSDAQARAFNDVTQSIRSSIEAMNVDLKRSADAEASRRSRRLAEQHAAADASLLAKQCACEWSWALRAALCSFYSCAIVLAIAGWRLIGPTALAWVRTYSALVSPSLVCGDSTHGLGGGPALWHAWVGSSVVSSSLGAPSPVSVAGFFFGAISSQISNFAAHALGPLPVFSCWIATIAGSLAFWLVSAGVFYVSPALLMLMFFAACFHGMWAQLLVVSQTLLKICAAMLLVHLTVLWRWHATFPGALPIELLSQSYKEVLLSERRGVPPGTVSPAPPPHADGRPRYARLLVYATLSGIAGIAAALVSLHWQAY
jgi:hypothetical protein